ncbi:MAG: metal ABC transporter permease [Caulobacteraceae bacterium]|nr:metal ABC transporter permease [Caulobacteraceae bacterium]
MAPLGLDLPGAGAAFGGGAALRWAMAGALALSFGGAPLGSLLIARRMSLMGDALSHGILLGAAAAFLLAGRDPVALTLGALAAAFGVTALASLLARTRKLPEDAAFAMVYLPALAGAAALMSRREGPEALEALLFGAAGALDRGGLILAAAVASASLIGLALFIRGFVAESVDPGFTGSEGAGGRLHLLLMMLVALNLVAGFRAFGALMTVALMMIPAGAARFWARGYAGQAGAAIVISALASEAGLLLAARSGIEPGAVMTLCAAALFAASGLAGLNGGLIVTLAGRRRLAGRALVP